MHSRHDLVWLDADGWAAIGARWGEYDWPLIVRRRDIDLGKDCISVGLALPPDADGVKQRVALQVKCAHIKHHRRPLPLAEALHAAPERWRSELAALAAQVPALAFGSLAMQALTGLPYLRESSDIDLLIAPRTSDDLTKSLAALSECHERLPLDGEIVFPNGDAVAWKEWLQAGGARVLVKSLSGVRLERPDSLLATLEQP
jgi:phosphoribosyl-dephospho-CoA transferase